MFGFPSLLFPSSAGAVVQSLIGNFTAGVFARFSPGARWGVFRAGTSTPAVSVSSVVALAAHREAQLSDYRIETGGFASYNKVQKPLEVPVRLVRDGSITARGVFTAWLESEVKSLNKYDIVTPDTRYSNVTLVSFSVVREAQSGSTVIIADCVFQEVREVSAIYSRSVASSNDKDSTPTTLTQTKATGLKWPS